MLKPSCKRHKSSYGVQSLVFEMQGCSLRSPKLPCTVEARLPCSSQHAFTDFNTRKGLKAETNRRSRQRRSSQPCFASLLQGSTNRQESKEQGTDVQGEASAKFQTAAGWSKHLLCGALSAVVSRTTMAPLERIKLEIVLHKRQETMFEVALGVFQRDGAVGFWKGNAINLLRTAPYKVSHA